MRTLLLSILLCVLAVSCSTQETQVINTSTVRSTTDTSWAVEVTNNNITQVNHYSVYKDDTLIVGMVIYWNNVLGFVADWNVEPTLSYEKRIRTYLIEMTGVKDSTVVKEFILPKQRQEMSNELYRYTESGYGGYELYNEIHYSLLPFIYSQVYIVDSITGKIPLSK